MQTTYRPGDWYVLVAPGALIALSPDAPEDLVATLWERQQAGGDLAAVIDALTEQASGSFAAMLPFAAVVLEGANARIAVRGDVEVQITGPHGSESFTGTNVTTWSERFAPNANRIAVSAAADDSAPLPITGGIVRAANVSAEIEPADVAEPDAALKTDSVVEGAAGPFTSAPLVTPPAVPVVAPAPEPEAEPPAPQPAAEESPASEPSEVEEPTAEEAVGASATEPPTEQIPEVPAPVDGAVDDSVDGATLLPAEMSDSTDIDEFEQLFGATIASPSAIAQPAPAPPAPPAPFGIVTPADGGDGDHDGATISVAEARALRKQAPTAAPDAPTAVLPVVAGGTGRVRVSTGQVVTLDRTVIIGRRPRSTRASGADLPHLIAVESPQQDISRSHLEIRPEGDTVVVVDLHTTNGSTLLRPGADPMRLHPGEQTLVLSADVVDLGDGVTVTFEDLP
ncbi:FHA domain-containing protein [Microbacterium murale]|uniref:FHA domain-containing protein n=1 Tax=Microbacterium murale TaxID=1081040 RepID=A0ABU0P9P4_9MICO|nr:FHA domain-containing protein [Microbacterium murale]MDQ0644056.1 hypothetical protein [Microbacterium murale]